LADLGVPAIKLGSGELDNHPLLKHVAGLGIPMIVSTGMGTMAEVRTAREAISSVAPDRELCLLHCTSAYPCDPTEVNFRVMETMAAEFSVPVGYSDHTTLVETPALAVAAGAHVVEKHFTLDSTRSGPDHQASLEPDELARAVELAETAGQMRGDPEKRPTETERSNRFVARKCLRAARDLPDGTELTREDVRISRPANGLAPQHLDRLLGTVLTEAVRAEEPFTPSNTGLDPD
jgi:N-acetylneuraminate synthase/N,N'-diacetyllegionaminate synthase